MTIGRLGVGIIGASGWAKLAHLPALRALKDYKITAVCTTRQESAKEISAQYDIEHAFTDPIELTVHPDVDLVVISVKVPEHNQLVRAALNSGKHVFCEWPLGVHTDEAIGFLRLAETKGVRHMVGLQARVSPTVNYVKDLLSQDHLGQILSVQVSYSMPSFPTAGDTIDQSHAYLLDKRNGSNQLTITAGHLLDGIVYMMSPFRKISAILETQRKEVRVIETGEILNADAPDYVAINGQLANGELLSAQFRNSTRAGLTIEIIGTKGNMILSSRDRLMFQWDPLIVRTSQGSHEDEVLTTPDHYFSVAKGVVSGVASNVAELYNRFAHDLHQNTNTVPDFETGVRLHSLLDHIRVAAETGQIQHI